MEYPADKLNLNSKQSDDAFLIESVLGGPGITAKNALNLVIIIAFSGIF